MSGRPMTNAEIYEYMRAALAKAASAQNSDDEIRSYADWARAYGERLLAMYDLVRSELNAKAAAGPGGGK